MFAYEFAEDSGRVYEGFPLGAYHSWDTTGVGTPAKKFSARCVDFRVGRSWTWQEGASGDLRKERNPIMSATTFTTPTATTTTSPTNTTATNDAVRGDVTSRPRFWRAGLVSGAIASVATTLAVVAARAADVDVAIDGEQVPLASFAQLTMIGALIGVALARVFSRRAGNPRTMFVRTTVGLTALSIVPDFMVSATTGSRLVLALTHVVAAAIVVPALAARLHD